jgi:hypothetical protein
MAEEISNRNRGLDPITVTLAAGVPVGYEMPGDWFHVGESPVSDLEVSFDSGKWIGVKQGMGFRRYYQRVDLRSATGQAVQVFVGFGSVTDGRASTSGFSVTALIEPGNTFDNGGDVVVGDSAEEQLCAADTDTLYVIVTNPSDSVGPVRVGATGLTAASGQLVEAGVSAPIPFSGNLYAYHENGANVTLSVAVIKRV